MGSIERLILLFPSLFMLFQPFPLFLFYFTVFYHLKVKGVMGLFGLRENENDD